VEKFLDLDITAHHFHPSAARFAWISPYGINLIFQISDIVGAT
jgi:hypothetical protein